MAGCCLTCGARIHTRQTLFICTIIIKFINTFTKFICWVKCSMIGCAFTCCTLSSICTCWTCVMTCWTCFTIESCIVIFLHARTERSRSDSEFSCITSKTLGGVGTCFAFVTACFTQLFCTIIIIFIKTSASDIKSIKCSEFPNIACRTIRKISTCGTCIMTWWANNS